MTARKELELLMYPVREHDAEYHHTSLNCRFEYGDGLTISDAVAWGSAFVPVHVPGTEENLRPLYRAATRSALNELLQVIYGKSGRGYGPCGLCTPPGILQEMESVHGVGTERCDRCNIYFSDDGAAAALKRMQSPSWGRGLARALDRWLQRHPEYAVFVDEWMEQHP